MISLIIVSCHLILQTIANFIEVINCTNLLNLQGIYMLLYLSGIHILETHHVNLIYYTKFIVSGTYLVVNSVFTCYYISSIPIYTASSNTSIYVNLTKIHFIYRKWYKFGGLQGIYTLLHLLSVYMKLGYPCKPHLIHHISHQSYKFKILVDL